MEKSQIENLLTFLQSKQLLYALMFWGEHGDKAFVRSWHESLEKLPHTMLFDSETKERITKIDNGTSRELLKDCIKNLENYMLIQSFVYSYDNIKYLIQDIQEKGKTDDFEVKLLIELGNFQGANILNFIRNNIAHNDDSEEMPRFQYMPKEEMIYLKSDESGAGIMISINHLIKLIRFFNNYVEKIRSDNYGVEINLAKLYNKRLSESDRSQSFKMFRLDNNEVVLPDEHQSVALKELANRALEGNFMPRRDYIYFYPHKDSSVNNSIKLLQDYQMLDELYLNRSMDRRMFGEQVLNKLGNKYMDFATLQDMCYPIVANLLFQMCSNNSLSLLQECITNIDPDINMRKVRNAIMHGTFFFDRQKNLVFYDGNIKSEEKLKYVAKLDFVQLMKLFNEYCAIKYPEDVLYTMESDDNPFPHVVEFNKD